MLGHEPARQRRQVRGVRHAERVDAHEGAPLVQKVQVADRRGAQRRRAPGPDPVEGARRQQGRPAAAVARRQISGGRQQVAQHVERQAAVDVGERGEEDGDHGGEDDPDGERVRGLHGRDAEVGREGGEGGVDGRRADGAHERQQGDLQEDAVLHQPWPVLHSKDCQLSHLVIITSVSYEDGASHQRVVFAV